MIYVGVDPDLHNTAIALLSDDGTWYTDLCSVKKELKGRDAMIQMCGVVAATIRETLTANVCSDLYLAVEGQEFLTNNNARHEDIGLLACVTGAAIGAARRGVVLSPKPVQWKGNVPKHIHHARIARDLGFEIEIRGGTERGYGVPKDPKIQKMLPLASDWKHAMDALGLALWAKKQSKGVGAP